MAQSQIRSFLILVCLCTAVLETAAQIDATAPANQQELSNLSTPQVRITEPTGTYKIVSWSGDRPSILVKGDAIAVPEGYRLFIAVHPTQSDNVWSSEVGFRGRQWVSQAFFGDQQGLPRDGDTYQVLAVLSKSPLPERFNEFSQTEYYASNIITVRFR